MPFQLPLSMRGREVTPLRSGENQKLTPMTIPPLPLNDPAEAAAFPHFIKQNTETRTPCPPHNNQYIFGTDSALSYYFAGITSLNPLTNPKRERASDYPHFTDREAQAQRGQA